MSGARDASPTRPRTWIATPAALFLVAGLVAAPTGLHFFTRAKVASSYRALLTCLAGPIDVTPEDAARAVRRRRYEPWKEEMLACAQLADALADDATVRWHVPDLADPAARAASELREGRAPVNAAEEIWAAGRDLRVRVDADPSDGRAPLPLVDRDLEALRRERAYQEGVFVEARRRAGWAPVHRDELKLSRWIVTRDANGEVVASARPGTSERIGAEVRLPLEGDPFLSSAQTCRTDEGDALLLSSRGWAGIYRLEDEPMLVAELEPTWLEPPASAGGPSLGCDGATIRVVWARSDPITPPRYRVGTDVDLPDDPQRHHIELLTCTRSDCSRQSETLMGLEVMWGSVGGFTSVWALQTPALFSVGDKILVLWDAGTLLRYRFGELGSLPAARNETLVEIVRRDEPQRERDPRAIGRFRLDSIADGGALLLHVTEEPSPAVTGGSFLVRFDAGGAVEVLRPPAP